MKLKTRWATAWLLISLALLSGILPAAAASQAVPVVHRFRLLNARQASMQATDERGSSQPTNAASALNYRAPGNPTSGVWASGFQFPGIDGDVSALVQDANGDSYLGGHFTHVGSQPISNVAKWNSATATWSAVGSIGGVRDLALAANGDLYAVGDMLGFAAMWNGTSWATLGVGLWGTAYAVAIDPASGDVYVGGQFPTDGTGAIVLNNMARWNGASWSALGGGTNGVVIELAFDAATSDLYAGGAFGSPGVRLARWNGSSWSAVGSGLNGDVRSLLVNGSDLYVGGAFTADGSNTITLNRIAKWNGAAWSALGTGFNSWVYSLVRDNSGNLYAGGIFTKDGTNTVTFNGIARWDGVSWSPLASGLQSGVRALLMDGTDLYAGGFSGRGIFQRWRSGSWTDLTPTDGNGVSGTVQALLADGGGSVYAGGNFANAGLQVVRNIARWNGSAWSPLGAGLNFAAYALAKDSANNVIVGYGSTSQGYVSRWNGATWTFLGSSLVGKINALAVDSGDNVFVAGNLGDPFGGGPLGVARLTGSSWVQVGNGLYGGPYGGVKALAVDGSGYLYAGGDFFTDGTFSATFHHIARWDGVSWSSVGPGFNAPVTALAFDGSGNLYAGGQFTADAPGSTVLNHIAQWNGSTWSAVGNGFNGAVYALTRDAASHINAGGSFTADAGGTITLNRVAMWDGATWSALGSGVDGDVYALAPGSLVVGGAFFSAGGIASSRIAQWNDASSPFDPTGDGIVDVNDIVLVAGAWPCTVGGACNSQADVDHDGDNDIADVMLIAGRFGCTTADACYWS
ncbi:MAG: hypothetical protein WBE17_16070 [Anaerolineae bacterium]